MSHAHDSHQIYLDNIDYIDEGNRLKDIMTFLNESITAEGTVSVVKLQFYFSS